MYDRVLVELSLKTYAISYDSFLYCILDEPGEQRLVVRRRPSGEPLTASRSHAQIKLPN